MTEFTHELQLRGQEALRSLEQAHAEGDDYLAEVRLGELESLHRLAATHGIVLPEVDSALAG